MVKVISHNLHQSSKSILKDIFIIYYIYLLTNKGTKSMSRFELLKCLSNYIIILKIGLPIWLYSKAAISEMAFLLTSFKCHDLTANSRVIETDENPSIDYKTATMN